MDFFDLQKVPVNLWRNGAGETREICCFPPAARDFNWRASIASIASSGDFTVIPQVDRVVTMLEGSEVVLDGGAAFRHTLKRHQPFAFAGEQPVKAELSNGMSLDFNIMTRRDRCHARVRVADRTFKTAATRGGVIFVLSGEWQLGDKLLGHNQGAWWGEGSHTLRLLRSEGQLLFNEITYL